MGAIFASALWEMYWNLVDAHGFDENVYAHAEGGGNNRAIQLVVDTIMILGCNPNFVDGREALLIADESLTGGEYEAAIWCGFAKRGIGVGAVAGDPNEVDDIQIVESFESPVPCPEPDLFTLHLAALAGLAVLRTRRRQRHSH
jgi:hypothetical protein